MALTGYLIVSADSRDALEVLVLEKAVEGYIPYGASYSTERKFLQTMVIGDVAGGGSGGGGGSIATLTDVSLGLVSPLATGDMLLVGDMDGDAATWINLPFNPTVQGLVEAFGPAVISTYLQGLPGFVPGNVLTVNATSDGFEWTTPAP